MRFVRPALFAVAFGLSATAFASPANHQSPLGLNIRDVKYWGTEIPTVDLFKKAGTNGRLWQTQNDTTWDTGEHAQLDLDPQGWVRSLPGAGSPARFRYATTLLFWGTADYPGGRYTVTWDGEGTLAYLGGATRNAALSRPGADVVDVDPSRGGFALSVRATDPSRTGNYLRNIRVLPPGGTCDGDPASYAADAAACPSSFQPFSQTVASQPFHPLFLRDVRRFSTIRFMSFTGTNTTMVQEWSQRVSPSVASWGGQLPDGAPYEAAIDMANSLDASPWFAMPPRASDDYARRFAELVRDRLTTTRPVWIEYGNEAWNGSYPYSIHGQWMQANGLARWPGAQADAFTKQMNWYGLRAAEICAIWKSVFASDPGRVRCVMGTQLGNTAASLSALDCPLAVAEGRVPCHARMDALAVGAYPGDYIQQSRFAPTWTSWFADGDGGLGKVFQELSTGLIARSGTPAVPMGAIPQMRTNFTSQGAIASQRGLQLVAYEAGSGLDAGLPAASDPLHPSYQRLQSLFVTASRDARIASTMSALYETWRESGGTLLVAFSSPQPWSSAAGNAALLEYQGQSRASAPKWDATLNFIDARPCWWSGCESGRPGLASTTNIAVQGDGAGARLVATVGPADARGFVTFTIDGLSVAGCESVPLTNGAAGREARCTLAAPASAASRIAASYGGDDRYRHSRGEATGVTAPAPSWPNHTGLWWNPAESGWGIHFTQQGDVIFGTLYSYDADGAPLWAALPDARRQGASDTFSGTLYRTTGPVFSAQPYPPVPPSQVRAVGELTVAFAGDGQASLSYTLDGTSVPKAIVPMVFGSRAATCAAAAGPVSGARNYQGLWWKADESGWGLAVTHQDDILFATLYTHDATGRDLWLVMSRGERQADGSYAGELYRTRGPVFHARPFTPVGPEGVTRVGTMRLSFGDGTSGTLAYEVLGVPVTKAIARMEFATPATACQ